MATAVQSSRLETRLVIANDTALNTATAISRSRAATVALWLMQLALAAMFLMAGGSKLGGAQAMIALFDAIGWGQWFRYVTGTVELIAAIALLVPSTALFGALLVIATMIGAVITNISLGQSPAVPVVLLLIAAAVAWLRRDQLRGSRLSRRLEGANR